MQRVELEDPGLSLHCPFCGQRTIGDDEGVSPCEHTLFIAVDEGLEYCSDQIKKEALVESGDYEGWDEATDQLQYPQSIKFALYNPPPSFHGVYIGYAAPFVAEIEGS